jgi:hypothetical protein
LVVVTSSDDLKHGRSSDKDSGNMDYIFNWRTFREPETTRRGWQGRIPNVASNIPFPGKP